MKFFKCDMCGNIVELINDAGVPVSCCGQDMTELIPGTSDASTEKHVPECSVDGNKVTVKVGSEKHPMVENHYIEWVTIETNKGAYRICLKPECEPKVEITLADGEKVVGVYSYCNVHGLWKAK